VKILYISSKPAYPKIDGGCVASANFLDNLILSGADVKYLAIGTDKHPFDINQFPQELKGKTSPESVYVDTAVRPMGALKSIFKAGSYNVSRFHNDSFESLIVNTLDKGNFDIVLFDSLFSTPYLKKVRSVFSGKIILRSHNVEFKIWETLAIHERRTFRRSFLKRLSRDLKAYESELYQSIDGVLSLSDEDIAVIKVMNSNIPVAYVPVSVSSKPERKSYSSSKLFHLGAMNWMPNIEAVDTVIKILPDIQKKCPGIAFHIAGIDADKNYTSDPEKGIIVDGFVEDLDTYTDEMGILISPILSGSGVRIKVLEMMSYGIPVITTTTGAMGLSSTDGIIISDSKQGIIDAVYELHNDENKRKELGLEAQRTINLHHSSESISKRLNEFFESI
jgi:glycosyltransferase involved in cell wall biosynthesis